MFNNQTDKDWEFYGKTEPYFGVVSWDKYLRSNLTESAVEDFFRTGTAHIHSILDIIHQQIDPTFQPHRTLDFGCGVGRLVIPLAAHCDAVVGVDVSEAMLQEAQKNIQEAGLDNVTFVKADDTLSRVSGEFDLIHSFIVFQHIPCPRGEQIARRLVEMLKVGGVGVLHFTYFNELPLMKRITSGLYKTLPWLFRLRNSLKGIPNKPMMQMNAYNLNTIFYLLQGMGCDRIAIRFTHHGHNPGVLILFQKNNGSVET